MKKIIIITIISLTIVFAGQTKGQGNTLVFNQVLTFAHPGITTSPYTIFTVPADRVWKIESMRSYRTIDCNTFSIYDGTNECSWRAIASPYILNGPMWLKAGDALNLQAGTPAYPISYFVSVIEFIVVPNP